MSERLRDRIAGESISIESGTQAGFVFRLTVSIGIAVMNESRRALTELIGAAYGALGVARTTGWNKICLEAEPARRRLGSGPPLPLAGPRVGDQHPIQPDAEASARSELRCTKATDRPRDVLRVTEVDRPEPGPGQVRVRIASSGVNPTDWSPASGHAPPDERLPDPPPGWGRRHRRRRLRRRPLPCRGASGSGWRPLVAVGHGGASGPWCPPNRPCCSPLGFLPSSAPVSAYRR